MRYFLCIILPPLAVLTTGRIGAFILAMQRIWKQREKQIEKVTFNTIDMHASIKGIAGNAIQAVKALELPESDNSNAN
jgi:hypothetical protein